MVWSPLKRVLFPHDLSSSLSSSSSSPLHTSTKSSEKVRNSSATVKSLSSSGNDESKKENVGKNQSTNAGGETAKTAALGGLGGSATKITQKQQQYHNDRKRPRSNNKKDIAVSAGGLTALFMQNQSDKGVSSPTIKIRRSKRQRDIRQTARLEETKKVTHGLSAFMTLGDSSCTNKASTNTATTKLPDLAVLDLLAASAEPHDDELQASKKQQQQRKSNDALLPVVPSSKHATKTIQHARPTDSLMNLSGKLATKPKPKIRAAPVTDSLGSIGLSSRSTKSLPLSDQTTTISKQGRKKIASNSASSLAFILREPDMVKQKKDSSGRINKKTTSKSSSIDKSSLEGPRKKGPKIVRLSRNRTTSLLETCDATSNNAPIDHDCEETATSSKHSTSATKSTGARSQAKESGGNNDCRQAGTKCGDEMSTNANDDSEDPKDRRIRELEAELEEARRLMLEQKKIGETKDQSLSSSETVTESGQSSETSCLSMIRISMGNKLKSSPNRPPVQRRRSKRLSNNQKRDPPGIAYQTEIGLPHDESCLEDSTNESLDDLSLPNNDSCVTKRLPFPSPFRSPSPIREINNHALNLEVLIDEGKGGSSPNSKSGGIDRGQKRSITQHGKSLELITSPQNADEFVDFFESHNNKIRCEATPHPDMKIATYGLQSSQIIEMKSKTCEEGRTNQIGESQSIENSDSSIFQENDSLQQPFAEGSSIRPSRRAKTIEPYRNRFDLARLSAPHCKSRPSRKRSQPQRFVDESGQYYLDTTKSRNESNFNRFKFGLSNEPKTKSAKNAKLPLQDMRAKDNNVVRVDNPNARGLRRARSKKSTDVDVDTFVNEVFAGIDLDYLLEAFNRTLLSKANRNSESNNIVDGEIFEATPVRYQDEKLNTTFASDGDAVVKDEVREDDVTISSKMNDGGSIEVGEDDFFETTPVIYEEMKSNAKTKKTESVGNDDDGEDDIFNSTPMQEKINAHKTRQKKDVKHSSRRGVRLRTRPDRFGEYTDEQHDSPSDSYRLSEKSKKKQKDDSSISSTKTIKRVRISTEGLMENAESPRLEPQQEGHCDWSNDNLEKLRIAHKSVNPHSTCFWDDVSVRLEGQWTAAECRDKWFSLVKTPVIARRTKRHRVDDATEGCEDPQLHVESEISADDDIFNATPMKTVVANLEGDKNLKGISNMRLKGSAIKVKERIAVTNNHDNDKASFRDEDDDNDRKARVVSRGPPQGYKTYLQSMRRAMKRELKAKKKKKASNFSSLKLDRNLSEWADEGDVEMNCRLSPGGTLQIQKNGHDSDHDYIWGDDEEEI